MNKREFLLELKEDLIQYRINATYDDVEFYDEEDVELEWWGHDGSLNAVSFWDDGDIVVYRNLKGTRLVHDTLKSIEEFEQYWKTYWPKLQKEYGELL